MQKFPFKTGDRPRGAKRRQTLLFLMKVHIGVIAILLSTLNLLHAGPAHGQNLGEKKVTLEFHGVQLATALDQLQQSSGVRIGYALSITHNPKLVTLSRTTLTLGAAMDTILSKTGLGYIFKNQTILVFKKERANTKSGVRDFSTLRQDKTRVYGQVTGSGGNPLTGVTVALNGDNGNFYGSSDGDGKFELNVPAGNYELKLSFVGYQAFQKQIQVTASAALPLGAIALEPGTTNLNEVVVIGYGQTSKRNNTGSVVTIDSKAIERSPVTNPLAALQGRVPGLQISSSNGFPGSSYTVRIRGTNSLEGSTASNANQPLFVIDGVPFISEPLNQFTGANGTQSPLASISPSDIERIDVLKDADATAIYGSRGANGVILVTTKKGKAGKTKVAFNVYTGASKVTRLPEMLNTEQYLALRRSAFAHDSTDPSPTNAPDLTLWDSKAYTNWPKKLIGHTAQFTEAQGSVSGGNQQTQFLLAGTYHHESTVLASPYGYDRGSVHLNLNHSSANGRFNINATVSYTADKNNILAYDISQYYNLAPNMPVYDSLGSFYWFGNIQNPIAYLDRSYQSRTDNLIGNAMIRYTLFPGLDLKTSVGYTKTTMDQTITMPERTFNPSSGVPSQAKYGFSEVHSYIIEPQATYTHKLADGTLQLLAGGTWQQQISEGHSLNGTGYPGDSQLDNMKAASDLTVLNYNYAQYRYTSVFGRINYNWRDKYIINGSFRRDGSSRFGPNNRFGNFGAIGAAWLFYEESGVANALPFLSFGKLRGSYGVTGNDRIGDYSYLDSWQTVSFPYGGITGITPSRLYNPDYSWETNKKIEVAMELGFLHNRIMLNASFYRNRSGNQLIGYTLSPQTGFDNIIANLPAEVENKGWEFELNTINFQQEHFNWSSGFNISLNKNKLLKYPGLQGSSVQYTYVIGEPLDVVLGYKFTGIDPATGVPLFLDANKDGDLSELDDYVVLGSKSPSLYGGFQNTLSYDNWSLNFLFQFVRQDGPGLNYGYMANPFGTLTNFGNEALGGWQQPGDLTNVPVPTTGSTTEAYKRFRTYYRLSSAVWEDASYIRLKNLSLNYNLSSVVEKWKLGECSIYFQAQNIITITGYKGFDPETQGSFLPPLKTYTVGLRLSL